MVSIGVILKWKMDVFKGNRQIPFPPMGPGACKNPPFFPISSDEKFAIVDAPKRGKEKREKKENVYEDVSLRAYGQNTPAVVLYIAAVKRSKKLPRSKKVSLKINCSKSGTKWPEEGGGGAGFLPTRKWKNFGKWGRNGARRRDRSSGGKWALDR